MCKLSLFRAKLSQIHDMPKLWDYFLPPWVDFPLSSLLADGHPQRHGKGLPPSPQPCIPLPLAPESEILIGTGVGQFIVKRLPPWPHHHRVVILVGGKLAVQIVSWHVDAHSHGLQLVLAVIFARGPVGAIATPKTLVVGVLGGVLDVDNPRGKTIGTHVTVKSHIHIHVPVACIERVAYHHVDGFLPRSGHIAQVFHLHNGSERSLGDHSLRAPADAVKLQRTAAVPASQSAQAIGVAHPKHVISHPRRQLRRVGIELRGLQDQSLMRLAVDVHGLSVVIIHPESHQLTFETDAMGVNVMIGGFRAGGQR